MTNNEMEPLSERSPLEKVASLQRRFDRQLGLSATGDPKSDFQKETTIPNPPDSLTGNELASWLLESWQVAMEPILQELKRLQPLDSKQVALHLTMGLSQSLREVVETQLKAQLERSAPAMPEPTQQILARSLQALKQEMLDREWANSNQMREMLAQLELRLAQKLQEQLRSLSHQHSDRQQQAIAALVRIEKAVGSMQQRANHLPVSTSTIAPWLLGLLLAFQSASVVLLLQVFPVKTWKPQPVGQVQKRVPPTSSSPPVKQRH